MRMLICKKFFDINVNLFFMSKNCFLRVFFLCLNLVISQKVIKIFLKLFLHVILVTNSEIFQQKNYESEHLENLDLYHLPAHCAPPGFPKWSKSGTHWDLVRVIVGRFCSL